MQEYPNLKNLIRNYIEKTPKETVKSEKDLFERFKIEHPEYKDIHLTTFIRKVQKLEPEMIPTSYLGKRYAVIKFISNKIKENSIVKNKSKMYKEFSILYKDKISVSYASFSRYYHQYKNKEYKTEEKKENVFETIIKIINNNTLSDKQKLILIDNEIDLIKKTIE